MELTEEQIVWGAASMLISKHGDAAPQLVAERIATLAIEGDDVGRALWIAIARCVEQLTHSTVIH